MHRIPIIALLAFGLCAPLLAADWPQFRGPNADGISPETGINKNWQQKPPQLLWKVSLTDQGFAGPSVAGGKVFIIDHQGQQDVVRCLNLQDGQELWRFAYDDPGGAEHGWARSTPVVDAGKVYTLSRQGLLVCLNAETGEKQWSRNVVAEFGGKIPQWQLSMSPCVDGDKVIVVPGGQNAAVAALDKKSGKTIWQGGGSDIPGYATPVPATILGTRQYVVFTGVSLIGVAADSGRLLWRYPWKTEYDVNSAAPIVSGNYVFITSGYNHGCAVVAVTAEGPKLAFENKEIQSHFNSPVFYKGYIYSTSDPGNLVCYDPRTGRAVWKPRGFEKGGLLAVDGCLVVVDGGNGQVALVAADPQGYRELGRIQPLQGQHWTAPVLADGKLLVRNGQALACVDLK